LESPVCWIVNSENDFRSADGVADPVQDIWPERCIKGGIVNGSDEVEHLVVAGMLAVGHWSTPVPVRS
jgi:hypothetical protein